VRSMTEEARDNMSYEYGGRFFQVCSKEDTQFLQRQSWAATERLLCCWGGEGR
jgi:hypothetical protein